jgi:hypothetical protein
MINSFFLLCFNTALIVRAESNTGPDFHYVGPRPTNGRAKAQAVSCRLPFARSGFDPRSSLVGFVVDVVALGRVLSEYFDLPG